VKRYSAALILEVDNRRLYLDLVLVPPDERTPANALLLRVRTFAPAAFDGGGADPHVVDMCAHVEDTELHADAASSGEG
jgi:hypothetical protein